MGRCNDWHNTNNGIANYLINNKKVDSRIAFDLTRELVYSYTKTGSYSERVLEIGKDFKKFRDFINKEII